MITHVAIKNENITISLPKPNRHSDCFLYAISLGLDVSELKLGINQEDQGFLTNTGLFFDRKKAAKYIKEIQQDTLFEIGDILISEDIW